MLKGDEIRRMLQKSMADCKVLCLSNTFKVALTNFIENIAQ